MTEHISQRAVEQFWRWLTSWTASDESLSEMTTALRSPTLGAPQIVGSPSDCWEPLRLLLPLRLLGAPQIYGAPQIVGALQIGEGPSYCWGPSVCWGPLRGLRALVHCTTCTTWATTGRCPIWHLFLSCSNMQLMSKLLDTRRKINSSQTLNQLIRSTGSTETAILKVLSDVYEAADSGKLTLLGLLDLRAAFDTVDHQILLGRLRHSFGISGTVLDWIASYLTGRTQFVRFNGQSSKTVPLTSGVPQGSVLGPILFLTYTAGVVLVVRKHGFNVHAYADDLQIYDHTAPSGMAGLLQRMAVCIEDVSTWMSSNRLCLNPSKTELIWLGSSRRLQNCATDTEMSVLGSLIRPVDSVRDLGVLIDSALTLSDHVNKVVALCYFHIRQLRIVRRTLTDEVAHSLVRAFIHNRIDYCNGILASSPKYLTERLSVGASCRCQTRPYYCPVARPFPLRCVINFTGWASNQEWGLSWLSWLTSRFTVWLRSTCLPVFQCRACQVAHIFDLLISGPCSSPEPRLWQLALGVFTVRVLASGTPCLCLSVTSICHWRLSGVN